MMKKKMMTLEHHEGDPEYLEKFQALYPFSSVDFFISETRDTGLGVLGTSENAVTKDLDTHYYAEPKECDPCLENKAKIAALERENAWLWKKVEQSREERRNYQTELD